VIHQLAGDAALRTPWGVELWLLDAGTTKLNTSVRYLEWRAPRLLGTRCAKDATRAMRLVLPAA